MLMPLRAAFIFADTFSPLYFIIFAIIRRRATPLLCRHMMFSFRHVDRHFIFLRHYFLR